MRTPVYLEGLLSWYVYLIIIILAALSLRYPWLRAAVPLLLLARLAWGWWLDERRYE